MADELLSREDFVAKYGFDPDADASTTTIAAQPKKQQSGLLNFGRSVATGVATAVPDVLALPQTAYAGLAAAYKTLGTEKPFLDEFATQMRVPDAQQRIDQHLQGVVNGWRQQFPDMTNENVQELLKSYAKSKDFEDYSNGLLVSGPRVATQFKDYVRELLGDDRPDAERSWVDSAGEILGSSLVGGPTGYATKVGNAAKAFAVTDALVNNPVSRAALKTAEVLTPLTMPYTAGNIALNTGVGVALDQALRMGTGRANILNSTEHDDAGIAQLAGIAGATGAAAAVVGAMKAHGVRQLQQSAIERVVANDPQLASRIPGYVPGQTTVEGGVGRQEFPKPYIDELNSAEQIRRRGLTRNVDESYAGRKMIEDVNGKQAAEEFEGGFSSNTGAALADSVRADTSTSMRGILDALNAVPEEAQAPTRAGMLATSVEAHYRLVEQKYQDDINALQQAAQQGRLTQAQIQELADKQADLARLVADDPTSRIISPEISRQQWKALADAYENSNDATIVALRKSHEQWADEALQLRVREGKLTTREYQELRAKNQFYVPLADDPLHGTRGLSRFVASFSRRMKEVDQLAGFNVNHETPIANLSLTIPKNAADQEQLIHHMLDPVVTMRMYTERNFRDLAHTRMRNQFIRETTVDANGQPSRYMLNQNVEKYTSPQGRSSFSNAELQSPFLSHIVNDKAYIPSWNGGKVSFYKYGDPEITAMLRQDPVMLTGMMRGIAAMSHLFKMNTTGVLAPVFGVVNAFYDTSIGMATHASNRAFGPLSYMSRVVLPERTANNVVGRVPDPTAILTVPLHVAAGMGEVVAFHAARVLARDLAQLGPFAAIAQRMGYQNYQQAVQRMLVAAEKSKTMQLVHQGVAHNSALEEAAHVRGLLEASKDRVPQSLRSAYNFYTDLVSAIHLSPKRMFYSENFALLERKYGRGQVPPAELDKLVAETRAIAGDMTRRPAAKWVRDFDAMFPYSSPIRNGTYHLVRNMTEPGKAEYVLPRLAIMMSGVAASMYMMTYWGDPAASEDYWKRTPDWDRWRTVKIPTLDTMTRWARGEQVAYSRDAVYSVRIAPDLAPIIAGTAAFLQQVGILPADASIKPIYKDVPKVVLDSLTPAMPPLFQAVLAQSGVRLDPQGSDTRGGAWLRQLGGFRKGPSSESATNLGEVSNSTSMLLSALFGANGQYLAASADAYLHATKFEPQLDPQGRLIVRDDKQYLEGLKAATHVAVQQVSSRVPDVPLLWKSRDRMYAGTPAWQAVSEAKQHIASIDGMRDDAKGKAAARARKLASQAGGIPPQVLADLSLVQIADEVYRWDRTGDLGQLKKAYTDLVRQKRAVDVNYKLPSDVRTNKANEIARSMQDNQEQQQLAIEFMEQRIAEKYGEQLAERLQGRSISMQTLDQMLREATGGVPSSQISGG